MGFKDRFGKVAMPLIIGLMTSAVAFGQVVEVGNQQVGCDDTNGVDPTTIPTNYPMGVAVKNGDILWTEINCPKLAIKQSGLQTVLEGDIEFIDVAVDPESGFTVALDVVNGKLYEVNTDTGVVTDLGASIPNAKQVKIANDVIYQLDEFGDIYKGGVPYLTGLNANGFDVRDYFGTVFTYAVSDTDLYAHGQGQASPVSLTPITNGRLVGNNFSNDHITFIEESGALRKWNPDTGLVEELGTGYADAQDLEQLDDETAIISVGDVVQTVSTASGGTVPVRLVSFSVERDNTNVVIKWSTETEVDNDHFEVQRSVDGHNWAKIGNDVKGKGSNSDYEAVDENAQSGQNYYRLKQVDINGDFELSDVQSVEMPEIDFTLSPNPTVDRLNVTAVKEIKVVEIFNASSQMVQRVEPKVANENISVELSGLASGAYTVRITQTGGAVVAKPFLIIK